VEPDDEYGDRGVYRVEIKLHSANLEWRLRVTNNSASDASVNAVGSDVQEDTLRPWVRLPKDKVVFRDDLAAEKRFIRVYNYGTDIMQIEDRPGTPIGGEGSAFILESSLPALKPGDFGDLHLTVKPDGRADVEYDLHCQADDIPDHKHFRVGMEGRIIDAYYVEHDPPLPCHTPQCRCRDYISPLPGDRQQNVCVRCHHPETDHGLRYKCTARFCSCPDYISPPPGEGGREMSCRRCGHAEGLHIPP
jgi:hypothetical protein